MLVAALFITAKNWQQPKCPLGRMDKLWFMHLKYYIDKNDNNKAIYNMDESQE